MAATLTNKQEMFCRAFIRCKNASDAYRKAYDCKSKKPATIHTSAKELLDNPKIQARIEELQDKYSEEHDISPSRVLLELTRIAFANLQDAFDQDGRLLSPDEWQGDISHAIQQVRLSRDGTVNQIKLWPKTQALDALAKHLGLFEKHNAQKTVEKAIILHDPSKQGDDDGGQ